MTVPEGFVETPAPVADWLTMWSFVEPIEEGDKILFPGVGTGNLCAAVQRYCSVRDVPCPDAVAVDTNENRLAEFEDRFENSAEPSTPPLTDYARRQIRPIYPTVTPSKDASVSMDIETHHADFLIDPPEERFDYILANPPYSRYKAIPEAKRDTYRERFTAATDRFGLFMPFIEQMIRLLKPGGWLTFLAPSQYQTLSICAELRRELRREKLSGFMLLPDEAFPDHNVEVIATTLQRTESPAPDGSFCVEALYRDTFDPTMRRLGHEREDLEDRYNSYGVDFKFHRQCLRSRIDRLGSEGGYNEAVIPGRDRQAGLEEFGGEPA